MIVTIIMALILIALLGWLVLQPLLDARQLDPLPDERDPDLLDLEEERDALLNALRELDMRTDLVLERREALRARYERKAAVVLRALEAREAELAGRQPAPKRSVGRVPWGAVTLVSGALAIAGTLGGFVLPRVGLDSTVVTAFEEDLAASEALRDLLQEAERNPSGEVYASIGDIHWNAEDGGSALEAYSTAVNEHEDAPPRAYQRLALLTFEDDPGRARVLLEQARLRDPMNPATLGTLAEIYLSNLEVLAALDAYEDLATVIDPAVDPELSSRLSLLRDIEPFARSLEAEPNASDLAEVARRLWDAELLGPAGQAYFQLLSDFDANDPVGLARVGEILFLNERLEDAIAFLERSLSQAAERNEPAPENASLFLGNARFSFGDYAGAVEAWQAHLDAGGEEGRVPQFIEAARGVIAGELTPSDVALSFTQPPEGVPTAAGTTEAQTVSQGQQIYQARCASCHGPNGGGGAGNVLAGNPSVARAEYVENIIRYGRGTMPGYQALLSDDEIAALTSWVVDTFAP